MTICDEVHNALKPLIDQGLVHMVQPGSFAAYNGEPNAGRHVPVTVMVNADNPEEHHVDIMRLVLQAGLKVELRLQPNPSRPRG